jgi:mannose/fructose/sorbose-specific phosphotransferase system IIB component
MIVLTRIDDRLIHGQVVEGWVNFMKATWIIVADDNVAANVLQRSIMELSVPQGVKVAISGVEEACKQVRTPAFERERVILLFSKPADVLRALNAGLTCSTLNIGGMRYAPGKRKLLNVLAVDDSDLDALKEIVARGVHVDVQTVPNERPLSLDAVFTSCRVTL